MKKIQFTEEELLLLLNDVVKEQHNKQNIWTDNLSLKEVVEKVGFKIVKQ
jgi:hypothetical protein